MAFRALPDPILLRKLIEYRPETGELIWLPRTPDMFAEGYRGREHCCAVWNTKNAGNRAFNRAHGKAHLAGTFQGQIYLAHRVAWAIYHGDACFGLVDHRNGIGTDNRIRNLRLATRSINAQNARRRKDSSSGATGVHWHVSKRWGNGRWVARIQHEGRRIFLGSFDELEEAIAARKDAERRYGFGPVHGSDGDAA